MDNATIRTLVIKYLDINSMVACSQVCRSWTTELTRHIWYSIDYMIHPQFRELDPETIVKHGHHIRVLHNPRRRSDFDMFMHPTICHLEELGCHVSDRRGLQRQLVRLVRQNMTTLRRLVFVGARVGSVRPEFPWLEKLFALRDSSMENVLPQSSPQPTSTTSKSEAGAEETKGVALVKTASATGATALNEFDIRGLTFTRASLSALLADCPQLTEICIHDCNVTDDKEGDEEDEGEQTIIEKQRKHRQHRQHPGIKRITGSIERVLRPNQNQGHQAMKTAATTPLFIHFPNLKALELWSTESDGGGSTPDDIKTAVRTYCPGAQEVLMDRFARSEAPIVMTDRPGTLETIVVRYRYLDPSWFMSILDHKDYLRTLEAYKPDLPSRVLVSSQVSQLVDNFSTHGWLIHLVLSKCPLLETVSFPAHEMNMAWAEQFPWACKHLKRLHMRFRGLDTKELIMAAVRKWSLAYYSRQRSLKGSMQTEENNGNKAKDEEEKGQKGDGVVDIKAMDKKDSEEMEEGNPIVDRVVKHLLQFEGLTEVWLGCGAWTVV
ncbi:hypothetical protein EDD11_004324 [Mortierella claussenii]|nr:hypothetical protein EDD11_004324 [Mortierella claussenii]